MESNAVLSQPEPQSEFQAGADSRDETVIQPRLVPVLRARLLQGLVATPFLLIPVFSLEEKLMFVGGLLLIILPSVWGTHVGARFRVEAGGLRPLNAGTHYHPFCAWGAINKVYKPYGFLSPEICVYYDENGITQRMTLWISGREREFKAAVCQAAPPGNRLREFVEKRLPG